MVFWISIAILVAGIMWWVIGSWSDGASCLIITGAVAVGISLVIMLFTLGANDVDIARYTQRYNSLVYQYENDIYENDNDLGKRELMKEIQAWNEELAAGRELQDNFWVGIYVPDIYDQFEFIELEQAPST